MAGISPQLLVPVAGTINAARTAHWHQDLTTSETAFRTWFLHSGQEAYRAARQLAVDDMQVLMAATDDLTELGPELLRDMPSLLTTLRMCTAPRMARERLVALAFTDRSVLTSLEQGRRPVRISGTELDRHLERICAVLRTSLDTDLFGWLADGERPTATERRLVAFVVADRRCESVTDQILRQAQRSRQERLVEQFLRSRGYHPCPTPPPDPARLPAGTFSVGPVNLTAPTFGEVRADVLIRPRHEPHRRPVLIRAVSTTDVTRISRRATDTTQLRRMTRDVAAPRPLLLLSGALERSYLQARAAEGLDWVWEHRLADLELAGL